MEKLNQRVEDWLFSRAEAESSKKNYLRHIKYLKEFCQERGKNLYDIVEEHRVSRRSGYQTELDFVESWQDLIRAYTTFIKKSNNFAPMTQRNILSVAKSFMSYWKIPIDVDLPRKVYIKYHNRDLTKKEIRKILSKASQRDRTIFLLLAESGLRAKTAIHIKYRQIQEDYENGTVPMRILTPASEIKDHVGDRWSFIGEDGEKELRQYLQPRMPLNDDDFLFTSRKPEKMKGEQFTTASISTIFRHIVRSLKLQKTSHNTQPGKPNPLRLHGLRKYFRNNMRADPSYREFWMGHSLGVDSHYISRDIEFHRKEYKKNYEQLRIQEKSEINKKEMNQLKATNEQLIKQINDLQQDSEAFKEILKVFKDPKKLKQFGKLMELTNPK